MPNMLGETLRDIRKGKGFTQAELAKKSGIGVATIIRYENGESFPSMDKFAKIMDALNTTIWEDLCFIMALTSDRQKLISPFSEVYNEALPLLTQYSKLNNLGKEKALERITELTEIPKYLIEKPNNSDSNTDIPF